MIVQGSTVAIDGFKSSGNGWGGINMDIAGGPTPSLVLSNASVSDDNPLYVEGGDFSVTTPQGWTKTDNGDGTYSYYPPAVQ